MQKKETLIINGKTYEYETPELVNFEWLWHIPLWFGVIALVAASISSLI